MSNSINLPFAFRPKLAIDIGSYKIRLASLDNDEIFEAFNVVLVGKDRIKSCGQEVLTKAVPEYPYSEDTLVWPVREGVIKDYYLTYKLLRHYSTQAYSQRWLLQPRIIASVSTSVSVVEKKAQWDAVREVFRHHPTLVYDVVVGAMGADIDILGNKLKLFIQIGAGISTISCVGVGQELYTRSIRLAGNWLDCSIQRFLNKKHNRHISLRSCQKIKHEIGTLRDDQLYDWEGVVLDSEGKEVSVNVSANELKPILANALQPIVDEIRWFLRCAPQEINWYLKNNETGRFLSGHIAEDVEETIACEEFVLSGGTAYLSGLADWLSLQVNKPVKVAQKPDQAVIMGIRKLLPDFERYSKTLRDLQQKM